MDTQLSTSLQTSLGAGYTLLGELGGGSMSRVFVAEEHALGRRVVVKVLPQHLATEVSLERFRREIQLAAALQHPLIVPVLSAGERDGLRYYTMPFIDGESLRATLARRGHLELPDVLTILRDVASALAYAHRRGVVHRDIKPDNILLCEDHALVTDFGVAKALESASVRHLQVTSDGEAVGTAAYMAPEQVTGDASADHRVDLYATGILAYELLTGAPPFTGMSLHGILTAHLADDPVPPVDVRPEIGQELSDVVLHLLAKDAADRVQTAEQLLEVLEWLGSGSRRSLARTTGSSSVIPDAGPYTPWVATSGSRRAAAQAAAATAAAVRTRRRRRRIAIVTGVAALALVGYLYARDDAARDDVSPAGIAARAGAGSVAVLPFRVVGADSSLAYLREGMVDLLAAKLSGTTGTRAIDPRAVLNALRDAAATSGAGGARGTGGELAEREAVEIAGRLGARQLVLGGVVGTVQRVVLTATLYDVPGGAIRAEASVTGSPDSLVTLVDGLAAQLLTGSANIDRARLGDLTSRSLPALKEYLVGQADYRRGSFAAAMTHYRRALELDTNFALAALGNAASGAYGQVSEAARLEAGVLAAYRLRDRLSPRDRAIFDAYVPSRGAPMRTAARDVAAWKRATEVAPELPEAWYSYADRLFHTGAWLGVEEAWQQSRPAFARALELDSTFVPPLSHLVEIAIAADDTAQVRRLSALYFARDSVADEADGIRWRVSVALGDRTLRQRVHEEMRTFAVPTLTRIMAIGQIEGVAFDDVERAAGTLRSLELPTGLRVTAALALHNLALNRGQPRIAYASLDGLRDAGIPARVANSFYNLHQLIVLDALYGGGDPVGGDDAARALEPRITERDLAGHPERAEQFADLCTVELWRVRRGDLSTADRSLVRLRAGASPRDSVGHHGGSPALCVTILDVEVAGARRAPALPAMVARLDSLMRTGPMQFGADFGNLVLARHHEALGHPSRALSALRRRPYYSLTGSLFLAPVLAEQGRLAERLGDRATARRLYRHYLRLHERPDPAMRSEVERVRAALARIED